MNITIIIIIHEYYIFIPWTFKHLMAVFKDIIDSKL